MQLTISEIDPPLQLTPLQENVHWAITAIQTNKRGVIVAITEPQGRIIIDESQKQRYLSEAISSGSRINTTSE